MVRFEVEQIKLEIICKINNKSFLRYSVRLICCLNIYLYFYIYFRTYAFEHILVFFPLSFPRRRESRAIPRTLDSRFHGNDTKRVSPRFMLYDSKVSPALEYPPGKSLGASVLLVLYELVNLLLPKQSSEASQTLCRPPLSAPRDN